MKSYSLLIGLILIAFSSCKKLDQSPEDAATPGVVFGTTQGLELYSNSFYDVLPTANDIHRSDAMSDYLARSQAPDFLIEGAFGPRQSSDWTWTKLRNLNYFLENNVNLAIPEATRRHYNGLARFFRAWFYFDKVKRFGDVPWINKTFTVDDPELFNKRDSRTLVVDSILADLRYACNNISTTSDNSRTLITQNIAWGFLSRVALFEGTFRRYHKTYNMEASATALLTEAAEAARKVMDTNAFSLSTAGGDDNAYRQLFTSSAPVASEVMLSNVMNSTLNVLNDANWYWTSATYGARLSFTRTFINTYLNIDGTPFTNKNGYGTMTFMQETKNRDKRLQQTIRMGKYQRINGGASEPAPPVFSYTYTGYQPIKWTLDDIYYDGGSRNINSICIMRYAEILLNYAEARAELSQLSADDWSRTVGALRRRAGITANTDNVPTAIDSYMQQNFFPDVTAAPLMEIRRERGIELALEGFRFYDIVRWREGRLMEKTWNGFYVPAVNTAMDLNEDGINDVYFYTSMPATTQPGVTYINVSPQLANGSPNPQHLSEGNRGELIWLDNIKRTWAKSADPVEEEKRYLYPIPEADRLMNDQLSQNPGW